MAISKLNSLYDQLDNTNLSSGATDIEDRSLMQNGDDITYTSGYINVNIGNTPSSEGDYLLHGLDVPITTTDFVLDFDYYRVSGGTNCFAGLVFRSNLSGESTENSNTGDYIRTSPNAAGTSMNMYWHNDGDSTETQLGYLTGLNSAGNWNYLRLTRTNGTTIKLERFSSSARSGSADATVTATNLSATWGLSLKYIGGYCAFAGSNAGNGIHERFQNIDLSSTTKGKIAKQRFVETFSGSSLDTNRWKILNAGTTTNSTGAMDDSVDGGYLITTGANNNDRIELDFNQKRQFSNTGSRFIAVLKIGGSTTWNMLQVGFMDDNWGSEANVAMWGRDTAISSNKFLLSTEGTGSPTNTASTLNADTSYHTFDATLTASNFVGTIDGTLTTTITTNLPDTKMQPHIARIAKESASKTMNIKYYEAYNT